MVRLTTCFACEIGDHKNHQRTVQAVPEGMMGGAICTCKGECEKDKPESPFRYMLRHHFSVASMVREQKGSTR